MVQLACEVDPRFEASRLEEGSSKSYSIETIERVRSTLAPENLYFLIGADAFSDIQTWFRWQDVVRSVTFIVVSRPGSTYRVPEQAKVRRLDDCELLVSSSEIRRRLRAGESDIPVPPAVAGYIYQHRLYR